MSYILEMVPKLCNQGLGDRLAVVDLSHEDLGILVKSPTSAYWWIAFGLRCLEGDDLMFALSKGCLLELVCFVVVSWRRWKRPRSNCYAKSKPELATSRAE